MLSISPLFLRLNRSQPVFGGTPFPLRSENGFVASFWAEDLPLGAVAAWLDKVGSNNAVQATGALQPIVISEADGKKALSFDGVDDRLSIPQVPALDFAPGSPISIVIVTGKKNTLSDGAILFKGNTSSSTTGYEYGVRTEAVDGRFRPVIYGAASATSLQGLPSEKNVVIVTSNGSTFNTYVNGAIDDAAVAVGAANISSNIFIGSRLDGSKPFPGSIRAIGIANVLLNDTIRAEIDSFEW